MMRKDRHGPTRVSGPGCRARSFLSPSEKGPSVHDQRNGMTPTEPETSVLPRPALRVALVRRLRECRDPQTPVAYFDNRMRRREPRD